MNHFSRWPVSYLALPVILFAGAPLSTIAVQFNVSINPITDHPTFDPNGSLLLAAVKDAGAYLGNIFVDNTSFTVKIRYSDNLTEASAGTTVSPAGVIDIMFTSHPIQDGWYFDPAFSITSPTPLGLSDFDASPSYFGQLNSSEQVAGYVGTLPDHLSVGETGVAIRGTQARGRVDVSTVALHELLHGLGLRKPVMPPDVIQFAPTFRISGGVLVASDQTHLADSNNLMSAAGTFASLRKLPSTVDLLATATITGLGIRLPYVDTQPSYNFDDPRAWVGNSVPGASQVARLHDTKSLPADWTLRGLELYDNKRLELVNHTLTTDYVQVGSLDTTNRAFVNTNDQYGAGHIVTKLFVNRGTMNLQEGQVNADTFRNLRSSAGIVGRIDGSDGGEIFVSNLLDNDGGEIRALGGIGQFNIRTITGVLDLDGAQPFGDETGQVTATAGSLRIVGPLADRFGGTMTIANGNHVTFTQPLSIDRPGVLQLDTGAQLITPQVEIIGKVNVTGSNNQIIGVGTFAQDAEFDIASGADLTIAGKSTTFGSSYLGAGDLKLDNQFVLSSGQTKFDVRSVTVNPAGVLVANANTTGNAMIYNHNRVDIGEGVTIANGFENEIQSTLRLTGNGSLAGATTIYAGSEVIGPGSLTNRGSLDVRFQSELTTKIINDATMELDSQGPATIFVNADFVQTPSGTLNIELRRTSNDRLTVSGLAALDGILNVRLEPGFTPSAGNSFDILDLSSSIGSFALIQLPGLVAGLKWDASQLYMAGILRVVSAGISGDFNNDGHVDAADYVLWRKNEGTRNILQNDPDGGIIGNSQYGTWRLHFGESLAAGALLAPTSAIPEPPNVFTLFITIVLATICWRSRSSHSAMNQSTVTSANA